MEKTKTILKTSTRIIIIVGIILAIIFLSFIMVRVVPKILTSMTNATVSLTSSLFPSDTQKNISTNTGTNSGVTFNDANGTSATQNANQQNLNNNASNATTSSGNFFTNFFGAKKTDTTNNSNVNFIVSTSSKSNNNGSNNSNNNTNQNSNSNQIAYNNSVQRNTGIADLAVQITAIGTTNSNGVFISKNVFTTSDTVVVKFTVENQGTAPSGAWSMRVNMPSSSINDQVKTITANSIPAGRAVSGQAYFNTPAVGTNQKVTIYVDPSGLVRESNKNNNQASAAMSVTQINNYPVNNYYNNGYNNNYNCTYPYTSGVYNYNCNYNSNLPNLTARFISLGKIDVYNQFTQGTYFKVSDKVAVKFEVTNNSPVYTSSWFWKAQLVSPIVYNTYNNYYYNSYSGSGYTYNSDGSRTYNSIVSESGLAPGETRSYTAVFDNIVYGSNYMTITIDSTNSVTESNEGDNVISQSFFVNY